MKTLIIYASIHHGNTEKVAKVMARTLNAELLRADQAELDVNMLSDYGLIGFGSGIYYGKHHESLFAFVDKLPSQENKKTFIFSTRGIIKLPFIPDFHKPLKEKLLGKGFDVIGEFSCRGWDTFIRVFNIVGGISKSRPDEKDLKQAEDFAKNLRF